MMETKQSNFRVVTMGIVAADKLDGSRFIEVYPVEFLPFFEGDITNAIIDVEKEGMSITGEKYAVNLKKSMSVKADWLGETNRRTAPTIKRGEQVKLWSAGDSERYWWEPLGRDDKLRTTESVTYAWAARGKADELTAKNTYYVTVDTINKHITLSTSIANGEFTTYLLQVNAADGNFTVKDGFDNLIQLDSAEKKITFMNADGTYLTLDKKDIKAFAKENFNGEFGKDFDLKVGGNYTVNVTGDYSETVGGNSSTIIQGDVNNTVMGNQTDVIIGDFTLNGKNITQIALTNYTVNGINVTLSGSATCNLAAPTIGIAGAISMSGPGGAPGTCSIVGDVTQTGNIVQTGTFNLTGSLTALSLSAPLISCTNINLSTINGIPVANYLIDT
jgi:hypothetical protein